MDENNRRRRQNEPPLPHANPRYHSTVPQNPQQQQQQQQQQPQTHRSAMAGSSTERYRPAPLNTSPPAAGQTGMRAGSGYGGYYQDTSATGFSATAGIPQNTMSYQQQPAAGYGQDARQTQNFPGSYNPNMMYNVPQAGAQSTSVYDPPANSFDMRQSAGQQIITPDVANTYFPSESTTAAAASAMQQQQQPSTAQSATVYQQGSADNRNSMLNYSANVPSMGAMATQATSSVPDVSMEETGDYQGNSDLNQAYAQYQEALKDLFSNMKKGNLAPAGESLRNVSEWLLSNVNDLGLTSDDQALHSDRIKLWNDFNHAWLGIFQMQKDLLESPSPLQRGQSLISEDNVQKMMDELLRHCDNIERYGLVDYQYGVWEERIVDIVTECMDLHRSAAAGATR